MVGLYIGSTAQFAGKNLMAMAMGLKLQKEGLNVGYMKPVGAMPGLGKGKEGDEDAFFVQDVLGLSQDPELVTPVLVTRDFKIKAFRTPCQGLLDGIVKAYGELSKGKDVMIIGGSGSFLHAGRYCSVDGPSVVAALGAKTLLIDRYNKELNYDYLLSAKDILETKDCELLGAVLNDVQPSYMAEALDLVKPSLEVRGIEVFGVVPHDAFMSGVKVSELAERLGGRIITAPNKADRLVDTFLIGTMQVENFLTHFQRHKNAAVIVGGDRADLQLVALEGNCPCLVLTGNLYPNDIIMTRAEVLGVPMIVVRGDTFSTAKLMETVQATQKLRAQVKINHGAQLINSSVDFPALKKKLGL
ncbi:MAG TPA: hypothetical protein DD766_00515 [Desulfovibrio sp.]|nr:hypothetical protein [Desulfovibrio sp.]HBR05637.1 hypothetical protein [Desulfovibrio sp.]